MTRVKINARDAALDIRAGLSDGEMMLKYGLSARGLQSLLAKLVENGLLKRAEVTLWSGASDHTLNLDVYRCPACNMPQFFEFEECPQCGVIVSKFRQKQAPPAVQVSEKPAAERPETSPPLNVPAGEVFFRGNAQRDGVFPGTALRSRARVKWRFKTAGWIPGSPAVVVGRAHFGSLDGHFYSVDALTGQEKWRFDTESSIHSSPAVAQSTVFFGSLDGSLYGLDLSSGKQKNKYATSG
ncbi:MAG: PQQ-binding-like beta-propeller repeat protein, partial [Thermodesulfobacteriota bacterium]